MVEMWWRCGGVVVEMGRCGGRSGGIVVEMWRCGGRLDAKKLCLRLVENLRHKTKTTRLSVKCIPIYSL